MERDRRQARFWLCRPNDSHLVYRSDWPGIIDHNRSCTIIVIRIINHHRHPNHQQSIKQSNKYPASFDTTQPSCITQHKDVELKGHTNSVDQLCFDPTNADSLASASADRTVRVWDTRMYKCARVINTNGENINIVYSPDGNHLAVGNKEDLVSIIDMRKFQTIKSTRFQFEVWQWRSLTCSALGLNRCIAADSVGRSCVVGQGQ
jgi:WD40 repeat protein